MPKKYTVYVSGNSIESADYEYEEGVLVQIPIKKTQNDAYIIHLNKKYDGSNIQYEKKYDSNGYLLVCFTMPDGDVWLRQIDD